MNRRAFLVATGRAAVLAGSVSINACAARDRRIPVWDAPGHPFASRVARLIPELMNEAEVPGCSMALIKDGRPFWRQGFGVKSVATGEAVGNEAVFEAASISKTVFSYAILKLAEQGVIGLDTPLTSYAKTPFLAGDPRLQQITARRVLSHTAGFQDWRSKKEPLAIHFAPGEGFRYSGEGYFYLQSVMTRLVGHENSDDCARFEADLDVCATDIDSTLKQRLLMPFGMMSSAYLWNDHLRRHAVSPHDADGKPLPSPLRRHRPRRAMRLPAGCTLPPQTTRHSCWKS